MRHREAPVKRGKRTFEQALAASREAHAAGRTNVAWKACEDALALRPASVEAWCHATALAIAAGRPEVALDAARRAVALDESRAECHTALGAALRSWGQLQGAIASLGQALALAPDRGPALIEIAHAFLDAGDPASATPFLDRALDRDRGVAQVDFALGRLYAAEGRLDDSIAAYRRAIEVAPHASDPRARLGEVLRDAGDLPAAVHAFEEAVARAPWNPATWSNLLLTLQCSDAISADVLAARHRAFGQRFASVLRPMPMARVDTRKGRRLRIGYVSGNFRRHALAAFFEPLVMAHDRDRFEIRCYSNGFTADDVTARLQAAVDAFTPIGGMLDGHVAAAIRRDEIDVLVDLDGHTGGNRLPVFFLRPAPIQVAWLGYLSSTGIETIDYRLTDARADPEGLTDGFHTERLWRLPRTAWCYRPHAEAGDDPTSSPDAESVTFACLNTPAKTSPSILALWAAILRALPGTRMILHAGNSADARARLIDAFADAGVVASRIRLVDRQPLEAYLATYRSADIALDPWPCAGGTTTCDALWMGVPVVTMTDDRSYSRTGASLLAHVGLDDLVVSTPDAYVRTAVALASDPQRRAALRASLRSRMRSSPLTDGRQFARDVEAAYTEMQERHTRS
jgi:predicted O-linked N-acetylglucosamine transferase (SPINDLY family)